MDDLEKLDIFSNIVVAICAAFITFVICRFNFRSYNIRKDLKSERLPIQHQKELKTKAAESKNGLEEFTNREKEIIAVTKHVYTAVGYGLANCIIIQGKYRLILQ